MKYIKYSSIAMIFVCSLLMTACTKQTSIVVDMQNVIKPPETISENGTRMQGRVIKFDDSDQTTDNFGPSFDFDKLR